MSNLSDRPNAGDALDAVVRRLASTLDDLGWDAALHPLAGAAPGVHDPMAAAGQLSTETTMRVLHRAGTAQPACHAAACEALALATRLDEIGRHQALGLGEARAALAEAAAVLRHQACLQQMQSSVLADMLMVQELQALSSRAAQPPAQISGNGV